ncbi:hypothetical protein TRVA0_032S01486 [Trichomonascus vanleenenianus]|uniref:uncharacterized protein n=1 Tax=Trichomonascus vanleenenianus TaxID=2268995 RepID=UPI003ECA2B1E
MTNMASPSSTASTPTTPEVERREAVASMIQQGRFDPSFANGFTIAGVSATQEQKYLTEGIIEGLGYAKVTTDGMGEPIMAYYIESPQNPLLGVKWARNNDNNQRLWNAEQVVFNDPHGRAVLLVMYLVRDNVLDVSSGIAKQAYLTYLGRLSDYAGLSNYERRALAFDKTVFSQLLYLFTDFEYIIRERPADNCAPYDIRLAEQNLGYLYCTEEALIAIRDNLAIEDVNLPLFSRRRHMLVVLRFMFERILSYQVKTIDDSLYRDLPDSTAGWYTFYALVFEYYFGLPQARAVDPWWKVGYPGAKRLIGLISDTIEIEELTVDDFKDNPSSRVVRLVYSMLVNRLNTILPNYAVRWLHEALGRFADDPTRLPDILNFVSQWQNEREHPCSDTQMMRHGVVFNLPPVTKDLGESIRTLSAEIEDPDCRLVLHNPFARYRPEFLKQKYLEGQMYRQRQGWSTKQPKVDTPVFSPFYGGIKMPID